MALLGVLGCFFGDEASFGGSALGPFPAGLFGTCGPFLGELVRSSPFTGEARSRTDFRGLASAGAGSAALAFFRGLPFALLVSGSELFLLLEDCWTCDSSSSDTKL